MKPCSINRTAAFLAISVIFYLFHSPALAKPPKLPKSGSGPAPAVEAKLPENATPEQVDAFMAGLSDEQARKLLLEKMKQEAEARLYSGAAGGMAGEKSGIAALFSSAEDAVDALFERLGAVFTAADTAPSRWPEAWAKLTDVKGFGQFTGPASGGYFESHWVSENAPRTLSYSPSISLQTIV